MTGTAPLRVEILPLTRERLADLAALFAEGGEPKRCWCAFWRVRGWGWQDWTAEKNREVLERVAGRDLAPGLIAYADGRAAGWVSVGPREDYERLEHSKVLARVDDKPVWSIVCFVVSRSVRGRGRRTRLAPRGRRARPRARGDPARGVSDRPHRRPRPRSRRLHRNHVDVHASRLPGRRAPTVETDEHDRPPRDPPASRAGTSSVAGQTVIRRVDIALAASLDCRPRRDLLADRRPRPAQKESHSE